MNSATLEQQALALLARPETRAALVIVGSTGELEATPVQFGGSVLNIGTELLGHLNAQPQPDEFVRALRDWAEGRLAAIAEARRTNGFVIPRATGRWEIAHVPAFQSVAVQ